MKPAPAALPRAARRRRPILKWTLAVLLGVLALCAAALLLVPRLLELPAIRAQLERELSSVVHGQLAWDSLDLHAIPAVHAVLRNARFAVPGVASGNAESIELRMRLLPLLAGDVQIQQVRIVRPRVRAVLAARQAAAGPPRAPLEAYRAAMQPVSDAIRRFAPDMRLSVEDAVVQLVIPSFPELGELRLSADGQADARGFALTANARGNLWQRLALRVKVAHADLQAQAELDAAVLAPQPLLDHLLPSAHGVAVPQANAQLTFATDGRTQLDAQARLDVPVFTFTRNGADLELRGAQAQGKVAARGEEIELVLDGLRLGGLVPLASGHARWHLQDRREAEAVLDVPAVDLPRLRTLAMALAGDEAVVRDWIARIRSGNAAEVHVSARAPALASLLDPAHLGVSGRIEGGALLVPVLEQEVQDIGGRVQWDDGTVLATAVTARLGGARVAAGSVSYDLRERSLRIDTAYDLDTAQALEVARRLAPPASHRSLDVVSATSGRARGQLAVAVDQRSWKIDVGVAQSDAVLDLRDLPLPLALSSGRTTVTAREVSIREASGALGNSRFRGVDARIRTTAPLRVESAQGRATLALAELLRWARSQPTLAETLRPLQAVSGTAEVTVNELAGQPDTLQFDLTLVPHEVRARLTELPEPLGLDGGAVHVTPRSVRADNVRAALLDARARVSANVADLRADQPVIEASVAEGQAGEQILAWIWHRFDLPERVHPKPFTALSASKLRWNGNGVEVQAQAQSSGGAALAADTAWRTGMLDVRRLHIRDAQSDATLGFAMRGRFLDLRFEGVLTGRSHASLYRSVRGEHPGRVSGTFAATVDRDQPGRFRAQGQLAGRDLHLEELLGYPLVIERIDLDGDGPTLHVQVAEFDYAGQKATLRGQVQRRETGPVIDAQLETPGVLVDALLPPDAERAAGEPKSTPEALRIWPLPVQGQIAVRAAFVQYRGDRVEPVKGVLTLEAGRARLKLTQAALCGIAFPLTAEFTPEGVSADARLAARGQQLEDTARCLSEQRVLLSGQFDLDAQLSSYGKVHELLDHLAGDIDLRAHDGKVMKFALLGNILALKNIRTLIKGGVDLGQQGFDYRTLRLRARIGDGMLELQEGALDSPAVGIAATGSVRLADYDSALTVLVAPFSTLDRLVRRLPVVGYVVGGSLTSVPVSVTGDIRSPTVLPLDPRALTGELFGIFERTLNLPRRLLQPLQAAPPGAAPTR